MLPPVLEQERSYLSDNFGSISKLEEVQILFNVCDNLRDKCILMTLNDAGLRVSEVASLKVSSYN